MSARLSGCIARHSDGISFDGERGYHLSVTEKPDAPSQLGAPSHRPLLLDEDPFAHLTPDTADRGSTVEEREAAVVWLQEAARDERQQVATARRKIAVMTR